MFAANTAGQTRIDYTILMRPLIPSSKPTIKSTKWHLTRNKNGPIDLEVGKTYMGRAILQMMKMDNRKRCRLKKLNIFWKIFREKTAHSKKKTGIIFMASTSRLRWGTTILIVHIKRLLERSGINGEQGGACLKMMRKMPIFPR